MNYNFKNFKFCFLLVTILLISCKKDEVVVDFRDSIVGTYTSTSVAIVPGAKNYYTNLRKYLPSFDVSFTLSDTIAQSVTNNVIITKYPSDASKVIVDYSSSYDNKDTFKIVGSVVTPSDYDLQRITNQDSIVQNGYLDSTNLNLIIRYKSYSASYSNNQFNINGTVDYIIDVNSTTKKTNPPPLGRTTLVGTSTNILKKQ